MKRTTIDIDIGGTFTDCYIAHGDKQIWCKARTTGYDLSVCTLQAIEEGAARLDIDIGQLLADTDVIRYSSTVAMNKLIQRDGPRLALITTRGFEDTIYIGRGSQWADGIPFKHTRSIARVQRPTPLIDRSMVVGAYERIDPTGEIIYKLDEDLFREQLRGPGRSGRPCVCSLFALVIHEPGP